MPSAWYQPTPAHQEAPKTLSAPVVLKEIPIPPEPAPYPGPKVCLPGRKELPKEEIPQNAVPAIPVEKPKVYLLSEQDRKPNDSLSRHVSLQTCAAIIMLALVLLLRTISEKAFLQVQTVMQEALSDLSSVVMVSSMLDRAEDLGMEESLRQVLSVGLEEEYVQSAHSESVSAMGGAANITSNAEMPEEIPLTAAAAGGSYPVSMEQEPFAVSVMTGSYAGAVCPVKGTLTSGYGPREHPITGNPDFHTGIDLAAAEGTPILAAASGIVEACGESRSLGNYVILRHSAEALTTYSHCQAILVAEGKAVDRGETIALVGSTGVSTGPHLHFECISDGKITDPRWILEMKHGF